MKVGIDIQSTLGRKTGIGLYTRNLVDRIERDGGVELVCFDPGKEELNTLERIKWENLGLMARVRRMDIDLLHVTGFAGPMFSGSTPKITTVHDLIGMIYPENLGTGSRFYWQKWLPGCVRNSDLILADSENTKSDIVKLLGVPEKKIRVVLLAVDEKFKPCDNEGRLRDVAAKYGLPDKFILNVGTIEPRKNIPGLIDAFEAYVRYCKGEMKLVLVGKKDWGYRQARKMADDLEISDRVIFADYVDDEDIPAFYSMARVFVYPSFYEGFGLPVLEAMSCGCPVIGSGVSSVPEIIGEAGLFIDPYDMRELPGMLKDLERDDFLYEELSEKALKRADEFSWERTAERTIEAYRVVLNV
jgi:glycosyltransferase involved in cell wall biosynthesis